MALCLYTVAIFMTKIIAFETSCDDTAVAIVDSDGTICSDVIYSQIKEHLEFGGVVPEIGSRAHIEQITFCTKEALSKANLAAKDVDAVAATFAPGLLGPLLVGSQFAKGFALANNKPLIAVHHIEGHILAGYLDKNFPKPPFLSLIVSGGHTALYLCDEEYKIKTIGHTLDDAAGEAFDKIGRKLGLTYPSGKQIDTLASLGDKEKFFFPMPMKDTECFNFSFSGLKTKALTYINQNLVISEQERADFCASFREIICTFLTKKTFNALKKYKVNSLVVGGGVAANSRLRDFLEFEAKKNEINLFLPPLRFCTDNAVMIAKAAHLKFSKKHFTSLKQETFATLDIEKKDVLTS